MILPDSMSVADLRELEKANPQMPQYAHRSSCRTYEQFIDTLYVEMDSVVSLLVRDANHLQGDGHTENSLNADICRQLRGRGYEAHFDKNSRGHSDITVEYGRYIWIGEGKKVHSVDNTHLRGGYNQLIDRYVSGIAGADQAGVVIYCYAQDSKHVLAKWREHLDACNKKTPGYAEDLIPWPDNEGFAFSCAAHHPSSGSTLKIKHLVVSLHWAPPKSS